MIILKILLYTLLLPFLMLAAVLKRAGYQPPND